MALLAHSAWAPAFEPFRGARAVFIDGSGNAGDTMIYAATRQISRSFEIVEAPFNAAQVCFLFGGGNLSGGRRYPACNDIRDRVFAQRRVLEKRIPIVQLPQSSFTREARKWDRLFLRERESLAQYPEGTLLPDMALGLVLPGWAETMQPTAQRIIALRTDGESKFKMGGWDPAHYCKTWQDYLLSAGTYEEVITDRLHYAIAGLLMRRRVMLLPNCYHKNRAMHSELEPLGCLWKESP